MRTTSVGIEREREGGSAKVASSRPIHSSNSARRAVRSASDAEQAIGKTFGTNARGIDGDPPRLDRQSAELLVGAVRPPFQRTRQLGFLSAREGDVLGFALLGRDATAGRSPPPAGRRAARSAADRRSRRRRRRRAAPAARSRPARFPARSPCSRGRPRSAGRYRRGPRAVRRAGKARGRARRGRWRRAGRSASGRAASWRRRSRRRRGPGRPGTGRASQVQKAISSVSIIRPAKRPEAGLWSWRPNSGRSASM